MAYVFFLQILQTEKMYCNELFGIWQWNQCLFHKLCPCFSHFIFLFFSFNFKAHY